MDPETLVQQQMNVENNDNKYMGYKIDDLSDSLGDILGKDAINNKESVGIFYFINYFESINWNILLLPSLQTILVFMYFGLLVCILGGISTFMWKKYDIKTKSQSNQTKLENQLLGGNHKYAKYVNAAVAYKIYQQEMAKKEQFDNSDDDSSDNDSSDDDEKKYPEQEEQEEEESNINQSKLFGGYQKTKRLRARNIRKQKLREQREGYERYKKRLQYEKQLKRYQKQKEKKRAKKAAKKLKQAKKNKSNNHNAFKWLNSIYDNISNIFENNNNNDDDNNDNKKQRVIEKDRENEEREDEKREDEKREDEKREEIKVIKKPKTKDKTQEMKEKRNKLEMMIIEDCSREVIIDIKQYYLNKIQSSDIYSKILRDLKSLIKLMRNLSSKHEICKGIIDSDSKIYFRWNEQCNEQFVSWIKDNGKCNIKVSAAKMLQISRDNFL